jgi:hypothetical protein
LRRSPVVELRAKQQQMLGAERTAECFAAQLHGRGLAQKDLPEAETHDFQKWTPRSYADPTVTVTLMSHGSLMFVKEVCVCVCVCLSRM